MRHTPEAGAVCGNSARTDLCGGRGVTSVPTATAELVPLLATLAGLTMLLLLIYRLRHSPRPWLTAAYWLLWLQGGPDFCGSWPSGPRHGRYHVLAPLPGLLLMALAGALIGSYRRCRTGSESDHQTGAAARSLNAGKIGETSRL